MNIDSCFKLGKINKPHGLKGEVRITLEKDFPLDYKSLESVYLKINNKLIPFFISSISVSHTKCFIKFEEIQTIKDTEDFLNIEIYLPYELLPGSEEAVLYYNELIDYTIVDAKLGALGKITSILALPGQDVFVMEYKGKDILIPASEELIVKVDKKKKTLKITIPEGLLEIYM